jgi:glycosyltransferase involved in cell wall biosynthesis
MRMLIDAVQGLGEVDLLFFQEVDIDTSRTAVSRLQEALATHWDARVNVFLCRYGEITPRPLAERVPFWLRCLAHGAVTFSSQRQRLALDTSHAVALETLRSCLGRHPDLILAFHLGAMAPLLRIGRPAPPVFFDLDNVDHLTAARMARHERNPSERIYACASIPVLWWAERRAMLLAKQTFVCSELDRKRATSIASSANLVVVPNAVSIPATFPLPREPTALYLGTYWYPPNVQAAEFLIRAVWPRVRASVPGAQLLIAGHPPDRIPSFATAPAGVQFLGFVDDLPALYRKTRLVCCPVRVGGGTRIKILEAAAFGRPVVSTTIGAEGIEFQDGHELFLRDDATAFADACIEVLRDPSLGQRMGSVAREAVRRGYDRDALVAAVRHHIGLALAPS